MTSIATISIYVHDLDAAVDFYTTHLGFTVSGRPVPVIVELANDGVAFVLCQASNKAKVSYPDDCATVVGFAVDDVDAALGKLSAAGVEIVTSAPQEFPGGRFIAVRDPSGNVVELLQFG
jgi:catechol 2,3-dioxygenase-like lactoylglutathione lyase family enzyme